MNFQKETYQRLSCLVVSAFMFLYPASDAFLITETKTWTGPVSIDAISRERSTGVFKQPSFITGVDHQVALRKGLFELSMQDDGQDVTDAKEVRTQKLLKTVRENMTLRVVDDTKPPIDGFIYTEALIANFQAADPAEKKTIQMCRQACLNFISDVNALLVLKTGDYLSGSVYFEATKRTVYKDDVSDINSLSNIGTVRLLQACIDEQTALTKAIGVRSFTSYDTVRVTTAETFNVDTVIDTCSTLLTSFNENSIGTITSALDAIGITMNSSLTKSKNTDSASTLDFFVAIDYDATFDVVTAVIETIAFDFNLDAFLNIEIKKGTVSKDEGIDMTQKVTAFRSAINVERLVKYYNTPEPEDPDAPVVGPGGNVSTLDAVDGQLLPLPKPDQKYIPELHRMIHEETGVFPPRHVIGEPIPGQGPVIGYKVRR